MDEEHVFVTFKCPNCGRVYNYGVRKNSSVFFQCDFCRYPLKFIEDVKTVRHPELNPMLSNNHVIGTISSQTSNQITCPYCQSTNTKKISGAARWLSVGMFGMGSKKIGKQWHCNKCGSDF